VNQLAVGQAVVAGGGADALDPQFAIFALFDAAVALGVAVGAIGGFLRGLVELALGEEKAFCPPEILLSPSPGRLVPRFTRAMGFSFGFPVADPFRDEAFCAWIELPNRGGKTSA